MAFNFVKSLGGNQSPVLIEVIVANSVAIAIGDLIKTYTASTGGFALLATEGAPALGFVHAITDQYGRAIRPMQHSRAEAGDWTVAADVVTVGSDNQTDDKVKVLVDVSLDSIYSAAVTGTIGTNVISGNIGASLDFDDEDSVDETTATRSGSAGCFVWGTDPADSTRLLVSLKESERLGTLTY